MMKLKYAILLVSPFFLLTSCSSESSIRSETSGDTITTSVSVVSSGSIVGSFVAGIGETELQATIDAAKANVNKIKSASSSMANDSYSYPSGLSQPSAKVSNSLVRKDSLYENSVRVISNSAASASDYKKFSCYNDTYGNILSSYTFIDSKYENIETRSVYKKDGEATTSVATSNKISYTLTNFDKQFIIITSGDILNVGEASVDIAGKLSTGETYVRFILSNSESLNETYNLTETKTTKVEYYFKGEALIKKVYLNQSYITDSDSIQHQLESSSNSIDYSTTNNGSFTLTSIPALSV